jgi:hypothetical protein
MPTLPSDKKFWTFDFRGGSEFTFQVPWNPPVDHNGRTTVHHVLCSEPVKDIIVKLAEGHGVVVGFWSEGQTEEQAAERVAMLGSSDNVYETAVCPECFWFDPRLADSWFCGASGWDRGFQVAGCEVHPKAVTDLLDCPARQLT